MLVGLWQILIVHFFATFIFIHKKMNRYNLKVFKDLSGYFRFSFCSVFLRGRDAGRPPRCACPLVSKLTE